jgi:hypothetical protein
LADRKRAGVNAEDLGVNAAPAPNFDVQGEALYIRRSNHRFPAPGSTMPRHFSMQIPSALLDYLRGFR